MQKVLFVEDEGQMLWVETMVRLLQAFEFDLDVVCEPNDAMERLTAAGSRYDAILLDVLMGTDGRYTDSETAGGSNTGLVMLAEIRRSFRRIPVVIFTIKARSSFKRELDEGLVQEVIEKPANAVRVASVLRNVLKLGAGLAGDSLAL